LAIVSNLSGVKSQIQSARPPSSASSSATASGTSVMAMFLIAGLPFGLPAK
jgi:hypothetical protein